METKTTEKIKVMQRVDIMEEDAKASVSWRQMSTVATPIWAAQRHKNKEKEQVKEEYMICWVFLYFITSSSDFFWIIGSFLDQMVVMEKYHFIWGMF